MTRQSTTEWVAEAKESNAPAYTRGALSQVLTDYFRCPEAIQLRLQGKLRGESGFFRFGSDAVCFGRLTSGRTVAKPLDSTEDVLKGAQVDEGTVLLPFDPSEVICNLQNERYTRSGKELQARLSLRKIVREVYYAIRPVLPVAVRAPLQRFKLRKWDQAKFPALPVDRTVNILLRRFLALGMKAQGIEELPFIWFWPDGAQGCAMMTHDVETASGRDFCGKVMDINDSFGIKSAFTVVPESRYTVLPEFIEAFRNRGFEANVHDLNHDGRLFDNKEEFLRRARKINAYGKQFKSSGFRAGVLYRNQEWFEALDFAYDMSVPNVAHLDPQGGGCCTVMPFFVGDMLELPLTATQDYTLFNILKQYSTDLWEKQMRLILEENGMISFIVHPDYIMQEREQDVYKALLTKLCRLRDESGVWIALPGEINQWWRARSRMELVREGGSWRVTGEGKERARVALAVLNSSGDSVRFEAPQCPVRRAG